MGYHPSHPELIEKGMTFHDYARMSKNERRDWFHRDSKSRQDRKDPDGSGEKDDQ